MHIAGGRVGAGVVSILLLAALSAAGQTGAAASSRSLQSNAGADQTVTMPSNHVTLHGKSSSGVGSVRYFWSEVSAHGSTIVSPGKATTVVKDLAAGTYQFQLKATDFLGHSDTDRVTVTVRPQSVKGCSAQKIVVLGSSTAAGTGAKPASNSWVHRYARYLHRLNSGDVVVNLAEPSITTYQVLPASASRPRGRPKSDVAHNVTAAIDRDPDAVIVNLPSNDEAKGYSTDETEANFKTITNALGKAGIPVWVATSQPRNFSQQKRQQLMDLRDWINARYGPRAIDFWSVLANANGTINSKYSAGDGTHVNNAGHQKLYTRVASSTLVGALCSRG